MLRNKSVKFTTVFLMGLLLSFLMSGNIFAQITQLGFQDALDEALDSSTRGVSATIIKGNSVWNTAANRFSTHAVSTNMHFGIASMTKTYVAALIFKLVEQGELTLDTTMDTLLYTGPNQLLESDFQSKVPSNITVRDLLDHTSGIADFLTISYTLAVIIDNSRVWSPYQSLQYMDSPDGYGDFNYTNSSYIILGMIVEHITGMNIVAAVNNYLLDPLNLNNTFMRGLETIPEPKAVGYEKNLLGFFYKTSTLIGDGTASYTSTYTCGNMVSTAENTANWAKVYYELQNGIFDLDNMEWNAMKSADGFTVDYGVAIERFSRNGVVLWGHTGSIVGFNGVFVYWPERDISIAILTNTHSANRTKILAAIMDYIEASF